MWRLFLCEGPASTTADVYQDSVALSDKADCIAALTF